MTSEQAVEQWLREVWDRGFYEGGRLVELLPGADNAARAGDVLRELEKRDWIVRSKTPQPTPSQRAFMGLTYPRGIPHFHAEAYGWEPNRDSAGLRDALGLSEVLRGLPYKEFQRLALEEERIRREAKQAREQVAGQARAARPPKAKKRTFKEAQAEILGYLRREGWATNPALKEPHATSPAGDYRLWFTPQSVYYAPIEGGRFDRGGAHSLFLPDLRELDGEAFLREVKRRR